MKIGLIGLGGIAQKAYLPVFSSRENTELVLCTRNENTLENLSAKYRIKEYTTSIDELIGSGIEAAFVHTATEAHKEITEKLLNSGVHVYVDKPLSYSLYEAQTLAELSKRVNKTLMVGFNRRFAPMFRSLKYETPADVIVIEKNRVYEPGEARHFIFDDFIHVVDTLRFLMGDNHKDMRVNGLIKEDKLHNVVLTLSNDHTTAIGIMNRDAGITEETVEYMTGGKKLRVENLTHTKVYSDDKESHKYFKDWDPVLYRRGFYQVIDEFITSIEEGREPSISIEDSLITHEICEEIVRKLL